MNNNEEIVQIYSVIAKKYAEIFYDELSTKPIDCKLYDMFIERLPDNCVCLELGCGPGEISNYFHQKGVNIIGIDKSVKMIEIAKKLNEKIEFKVDDVFQLKLESGKFDGIVAPYLIVNFSNKEVEKSIREMNRVLKSTGILLMSFHIGNNKKLKAKNFLGSAKSMIFILHKVDKIKRLIINNGFRITEVITREPYEGEVTTRTYIYAEKI